MGEFVEIFKKVHGLSQLKQYANSHVLLFACVQTILLGLSKKSLEIVRLSVDNKIVSRLRRKYRKQIKSYRETHKNELNRVRSKKVWFLWLQGLEQAPEVVKLCYQSIMQNMSEREVILLTERNYRDYVEFPEYIEKKINSGAITKTHMSDLLRLELLNRYGGIWVDATVYCSGENIPEYMLESDLFLFQNLKPGLDGQSTCISSWFICSTTNNPILLLVQDLLYTYWKKENKLKDYFLIHDFFQLAIEAFPEEWKNVIPFSNSEPHILLLRLFDEYDEKIWKEVKDRCPFHKLTYKYEEEKLNIEGTYFEQIILGKANILKGIK